MFLESNLDYSRKWDRKNPFFSENLKLSEIMLKVLVDDRKQEKKGYLNMDF